MWQIILKNKSIVLYFLEGFAVIFFLSFGLDYLKGNYTELDSLLVYSLIFSLILTILLTVMSVSYLRELGVKDFSKNVFKLKQERTLHLNQNYDQIIQKIKASEQFKIRYDDEQKQIIKLESVKPDCFTDKINLILIKKGENDYLLEAKSANFFNLSSGDTINALNKLEFYLNN